MDNPFLLKPFELGTAGKHYAALAHGEFGFPEHEFVWELPLGLESGGRTNPRGKGILITYSTQIRLVEQSPHYALVVCELLTGRKHQIVDTPIGRPSYPR